MIKKVFSYADEYPKHLEIDPTNVTHIRSYKLGDLSNSLPNGMVLHPKYKSNLHQALVKIGGDIERITE